MTKYEMETIADIVFQKIQSEKSNKTMFYKIIDEFEDEYQKTGNSGKVKSSISGLASTYFNLGNRGSQFKAVDAQELRMFIRNTLNILSNKEAAANTAMLETAQTK